MKTVVVFLLGIMFCCVSIGFLHVAHADDSMASPANRIAKSLEDISQTLKSIDRKIK